MRNKKALPGASLRDKERAAAFVLESYSTTRDSSRQASSTNRFEQAKRGSLSQKQEQALIKIRGRLGFQAFQDLKRQAGIDPSVPIARLSKSQAWQVIHIASQGVEQ